MQFLNNRRKSVAINVTSLIDVMFLLLIFVLLSAKFEKEGSVPVNLPSGGKTETAETKPEIKILSIDAAGKMFLGKTPVTLEELPAAIKRMRAEMKDPVLVINADKDGAYGAFARAMDVIQKTGQTKFSLKFTPPAE